MNATTNNEFDLDKAATDLVGLWRAGGTLAQAMDITDDECEALYAFGHALYKQGKYADAFKAFSQATVYNHLESRYQEAAGAAAQMLGRYEDALRHYMAVTMMRLDDPAPVFHCAECLLEMGKLPEAVESLELADELCKRNEQKYATLSTRIGILVTAIKTKQSKQ